MSIVANVPERKRPATSDSYLPDCIDEDGCGKLAWYGRLFFTSTTPDLVPVRKKALKVFMINEEHHSGPTFLNLKRKTD